jgi:hypothetical protein
MLAGSDMPTRRSSDRQIKSILLHNFYTARCPSTIPRPSMLRPPSRGRFLFDRAAGNRLPTLARFRCKVWARLKSALRAFD